MSKLTISSLQKIETSTMYVSLKNKLRNHVALPVSIYSDVIEGSHDSWDLFGGKMQLMAMFKDRNRKRICGLAVANAPARWRYESKRI